MGQVGMLFTYETPSLEECDPCSNFRFCYLSSTVLNIHGQATAGVLERNLDYQRTILLATSRRRRKRTAPED